MSYTDKHKLFLQTIMEKGALNERESSCLVTKLFDHSNVPTVVDEINQKLKIFNVMIRSAMCEITGQVYWILANIVYDEKISLPAEFSQAQLALLRAIFSEIITSAEGYVPSITCFNLCSSMDFKLTKADAEEFLNEMVTKKWLCYEGGQYYMGVRSIGELMPYFKATYENNAFNSCCLCRHVIFYGKKCSNCEAYTHLPCIKNYLTVHDQYSCPKCNSIVDTSN